MHGRVPLPKPSPLPRGFGLRVHVAILVAIGLLPALLLVGLTFSDAAGSFRRDVETRLAGEARALAKSIRRDIRVQQAVVEALASLPEAAGDPDQLADFDMVARRLAATLDGWVVLWDARTPTQLVNTRMPRGSPLPTGLTPGPIRQQVVDTGGPIVSQLFTTPRIAQPFVGVLAPVLVDGQVNRVVSLHTHPDRQLALLSQATLPPGGVVTLVDGNGRVIARSVDHARWVGSEVPGWKRENIRSPRVLRRNGLDGSDLLVASAPVPDTPDWAVAVAEPWRPFITLRNEAFAKPLLGAIGAIALGIAIAVWFAGRMVRPVEALAADAAAEAGAGTVPPPPPAAPSGIRELDQLAAEIARARESLRRRAEEAEEKTALIESVMDATADPLFAKDLDLRFVLANRATNRVVGDPAAALAGHTAFDTADPVSAALAESQDRMVIETGEPWSGEHRIQRPDGEQLFHTTKVPWRDARGRVIGVVGVARDITRARAAEQRLAAAHTRLLQVSRLGATGAMAAGLAHEINQPLTAVANYVGAAARLLGEPGTPPPPAARVDEVRRALPNAIAQARRAGAILARLRGFISDDATDLRPEPLEEVLRDAALIAAGTLERERAELVLDIAKGLGSATIDRVQIQQVLFNLLRNAAEAVRDRSLRRIRLSARRVSVPGNGVVIEVADTGPGLDDDVRAHLFEPFVTTKSGGLGVGLAICRRAVELHGGRLSAEPAPEGGALFRIALPDHGT